MNQKIKVIGKDNKGNILFSETLGEPFIMPDDSEVHSDFTGPRKCHQCGGINRSFEIINAGEYRCKCFEKIK